MDWRDRAECRPGTRHDPDLWFPVGNDGPALIQSFEAKAVCRGCPVGAECLEWALESRQDHGIWGGLTEEERRSRKRRRVRAAGQQSETRRSAREVDELTVQHLMDGVTVPGATRTDRLEAAVRLVCGGAENEPTAERLNVCSATVRNRVRELQGQNPRAAR